MKRNISYLSILLVICMLLGVLSACSKKQPANTTPVTPQGTESNAPQQDDTEGSNGTGNGNGNTNTEKSTETQDEKNTEAATNEGTDVIYDLEGIYADSIVYADEIKNGVQAYYTDGTTRLD